MWYHNRTPGNVALVERQCKEYNIDWNCMKQDVTNAECVFLPISFEEKVPRIYWKDEWKTEDFD